MVLPIIFEDEHLLIADKPSGVAVITERGGNREKTFLAKMETRYGKLFVVHRIDKWTSGAICFAKTAHAHRALQELFESRRIEKKYLAVVRGTLLEKEGIIQAPLAENKSRPGTMKVDPAGKEAITEYRVLENFRHATLLQISIKTGRLHQIRVHLKHIGHPLLVDEIYTDQQSFHISSVIKHFKKPEGQEQRPTIARLTLHAAEIRLEHPITRAIIRAEAPLPQDMNILLKLLRKYDARFPAG
jgi:23S rRNA pseudouridine955/2504/2580 synthase/23S rRNA pseudouridine1911/1915/1917 synthase